MRGRGAGGNIDFRYKLIMIFRRLLSIIIGEDLSHYSVKGQH